MKYKFGWGKEEELAELDKMEAEMLANIPKAPTQPVKDTSVVTDTLAQAQETAAAPAEVITKYQINDSGKQVPVLETYEVKEIISLATIRAALGTTFRITGLDSPSESSELALLLRAGALAAPMRFVE